MTNKNIALTTLFSTLGFKYKLTNIKKRTRYTISLLPYINNNI